MLAVAHPENYWWPLAHCTQMCMISHLIEDGEELAETIGALKEWSDLYICMETGDPDKCYSAYQPSDLAANEAGIAAPESLACWDLCEESDATQNLAKIALCFAYCDDYCVSEGWNRETEPGPYYYWLSEPEQGPGHDHPPGPRRPTGGR